MNWPKDFIEKTGKAGYWYKFVHIAEQFELQSVIGERFYFRTSKDAKRFYDKVKSTSFKILWDKKSTEVIVKGIC